MHLTELEAFTPFHQLAGMLAFWHCVLVGSAAIAIEMKYLEIWCLVILVMLTC